mgnify:CR=1 FL=1
MTDASRRSPGAVAVAGFFPPPVTGQSVATERLASLLGDELPVERIDLGVRDADDDARTSRFRLDLIGRMMCRRRSWREQAAAGFPTAWESISPSQWGVWRDALLMHGVWQPGQRVWGVVHHGDFADALAHPIRRIALRRTLSRLSGLVLLSDTLRQACAPLTGDLPLHVIPNTVNETSIATPAELDQRREHPSGGLRLLFLSNMIAEKGYRDVLHAAAVLAESDHLDHVTFAGAWPDDAARRAFESETESLGIAPRTHVLGPVYDADAKRRLFLRCDAFVLPTYYPTEAQPLTILEALATGTPVVATRQGGIGEMVGEAEASFVPPRNPRALADALRSFSDQTRWLAASQAARARFDTAYHPDYVRRLWLDLLATE